jgi:hypothetical protein
MRSEFAKLPKTRAEAIRLGIDRFFTGKPCRRGHLAPRTRDSASNRRLVFNRL